MCNKTSAGFSKKGWDFCPMLHWHCVVMLDLNLSNTWLPGLCSCHSASWCLIWLWARGQVLSLKYILKCSTVSQLVWILLILRFVYSWRDKIPWSPLRTLSGNEGSLVAYVIWPLLIFPVCLYDPLLQFKRHINLRYKVQLFGEVIVLALIHASFSSFEISFTLYRWFMSKIVLLWFSSLSTCPYDSFGEELQKVQWICCGQ